MSFESINRSWFLLLNATPDASPAIVALARFGAEWIVYVLVASLIVAWIRGPAEMRRGVVFAALTAMIALIVNQIIAAAWFHPRPFMLGLGTLLVPHAPETSFPSDHATLAFALAFGLLCSNCVRAALCVLAAAAVVAWSRVYVGVHFPFDMLGALLVSAGIAVCTLIARRFVDEQIVPVVSTSYGVVRRRLRLPDGMFPP